MKYFKRKNIYKNYNGSNKYLPESQEAYSYDWWLYFKDYDGLKVFNEYRYSPTTAKHQRDMLSFLQEEMNMRPDTFWRVECPGGLQRPDSGIELYQNRITELQELINKKGTRKTKNQERKSLIRQYQTKIEMLERLKGMVA